MIQLEQKPGRTTVIHNEEYLFFSGYSYLGLGSCAEFIELVKKGIDQYGIVYPSSRISNTPLGLYEDFENKLAGLTQTKAAATFSSGFLSARTAAEVVGKSMNIYSLPHTHPASAGLPDIKPIPADQSWKEFLQQKATDKELRFGLVADSIYPTPGHINDFSFLQHTPPDFKITLVLDDSHGIGWMGANGEGIISQLNLPGNIELLLNFSLSKAFHINAGAVSGSALWIQRIKDHVNYTSSTPVMPALAYAWINASDIFHKQRTVLQENINYLQKLASDFTFVTNEGTPVFAVDKKEIAAFLLEHKVIISSFGYPKPENDPVNRIVINAQHFKTDLEQLTGLIDLFIKKIYL